MASACHGECEGSGIAAHDVSGELTTGGPPKRATFGHKKWGCSPLNIKVNLRGYLPCPVVRYIPHRNSILAPNLQPS